MNRQLNMDLTNDEFQQFLTGDEFVFRKVFNSYHQVLYRYAYAVVKCDFEAEEVVQEAFIQLFKGCQNMKESRQLYPYLFVIVKRQLIQIFRKKLVQAKYNSYIEQNWTESSRCTQQQLEVNDLSNLLQSAMEDLSVKEKEMYTLNKISGLSYDEISDFTGASRNTIKNQIISASKKIRLQLQKYYFLFLF
ncbi:MULTISPECIES: RNA polymerase sigma factor [Sphingobacterium]|uniref:RNA polymerase sigma factor n=1 Tax=Sphingobacterium TaxID=28453 RepID=UPI0013D92CEB|nr:MULTISPECIES: RNA polymerase sigma factor [unclassified Sphingobacterium]